MKVRPTWLFVGVLLSMAAGNTVNATTTIDFEGKSGSASGIGSSLDIDGYRFTITGANASGFEVVTNQADAIEPGTTKLFAANHVDITMTKVGGGLFSLLSLDIGGSFVASPERWADHVDVIGGGTVTALLDGHGPTYVHLTPNFLNVTSVLFQPFVNDNGGINNYEYTLDNLEIADAAPASVPEPGSLVLLALGLAAVALRRRAGTRER